MREFFKRHKIGVYAISDTLSLLFAIVGGSCIVEFLKYRQGTALLLGILLIENGALAKLIAYKIQENKWLN